MEKTLRSFNWFKERIGKIIFRNSNYCSCSSCKIAEKKGIEIIDEQHAEYLFNIQNEYFAEKIHLNYRDLL